jgi:hypothetical protein
MPPACRQRWGAEPPKRARRWMRWIQLSASRWRATARAPTCASASQVTMGKTQDTLRHNALVACCRCSGQPRKRRCTPRHRRSLAPQIAAKCSHECAHDARAALFSVQAASSLTPPLDCPEQPACGQDCGPRFRCIASHPISSHLLSAPGACGTAPALTAACLRTLQACRPSW